MKNMTIYLNGARISISSEATLLEVLLREGYRPGSYAVALNNEFIPKEHHASIQFKNDDRIDLVTPMQGG